MYNIETFKIMITKIKNEGNREYLINAIEKCNKLHLTDKMALIRLAHKKVI